LLPDRQRSQEDPALLCVFFDRCKAADCDVVYGFQERRKGDALESAGGKIAWYWISKLYSIDIRSTSAPCG